MERIENKKIYQKRWFCILMFIFICPIGVFLICKNKIFNRIVRVLLVTIAIPYSFIGILFWIAIFSKNSSKTNLNGSLANIGDSKIKEVNESDENHNNVEDKNINDYVFGEPEFLKLYLKENRIEKINFSDEKKLVQIDEKLKSIDISSSKFNYLDAAPTNKNSIEESFNQYKTTNKITNVIYVGELKNNKPNGIGAVAEIINYNGNKLLVKKYVGNFKDGYFNGYGKLYNIPLQDDYNALE